MPVPRLAGLPNSFDSDVQLRALPGDSRTERPNPEPLGPEPLSAVVARFNLAIREQDWAVDARLLHG